VVVAGVDWRDLDRRTGKAESGFQSIGNPAPTITTR
jgi:hypothetical protein